MKVAIVGAGWAGLAAAVEATRRGHAVTVLEMAPHPGGRARRIPLAGPRGLALDNGQHILIGAYSESLRLMQAVGVDVDRALLRRALTLRHVDGRGLDLPAGAAPAMAFARGVMSARGWPLVDRLKLLSWAARCAVRRFRCDPGLTVADLSAGLPRTVRADLIEPLCVAALNTPASRASAQVWLRVLHDALFSGRGGSDLLLPRVDLGQVLPDPALAWLHQQGSALRHRCRVTTLEPSGTGWTVQSTGGAEPRERFDAVILAAPPWEAARLAQAHAPEWAGLAGALAYEPIVTVVLAAPGRRLERPMVALEDSALAPAQILFDLGQVRDTDREPGAQGCFAAVISGAGGWLARGLDITAAAVQAQLRPVLGDAEVVQTLCEKRATFLCTPNLRRPGMTIANGLVAAGDYVDGPYPATLEGAVRSGVRAAGALGDALAPP